MYLRLISSRLVRCLPRHQPIVTRNFERCACTLQRNLIPQTSNISSIYYQQYRYKRKGPKRVKTNQDENDSDSDTDDEQYDVKKESDGKNFDVEPGAKIITYKLDSPRLDKLLRRVLNIPRKDVEDLFYDKKIQLNGEVLVKKSYKVDEGDIITAPLENATGSGNTARGVLIEVLEIIENENSSSVKVSRNKNTLVKV